MIAVTMVVLVVLAMAKTTSSRLLVMRMTEISRSHTAALMKKTVLLHNHQETLIGAAAARPPPPASPIDDECPCKYIYIRIDAIRFVTTFVPRVLAGVGTCLVGWASFFRGCGCLGKFGLSVYRECQPNPASIPRARVSCLKIQKM